MNGNNCKQDKKSTENGHIGNLNNFDSKAATSSDHKNKTRKSKFIFLSPLVDFITYILIMGCVYCSYLMLTYLDSFTKRLRAFNPEYKFPEIKDLLPSLWMSALLFIIHQVFKFLTVDKIEKYLSKNYGKEEILIYKNKVSTNIVKFFLYFSSTVLGFYTLKKLNFFPWTLGGKGEYKNLFDAGYPKYLFFEKTEYFDFYYNFNFAFAIFDTYILLVYPLQSDFLLMILHHFVTLTLIIFSFLTNYSNIGCIVYFIHYSGDIMSMIVRIAIHLNIPQIISCYFTFFFLVIFIYTRLFVFGDVLYRSISFIWKYDYQIYSVYMICFLSIIMILNIIWIVLISKKFINYLLTGKVEEIYKLKKNNNTEKKNI